MRPGLFLWTLPVDASLWEARGQAGHLPLIHERTILHAPSRGRRLQVEFSGSSRSIRSMMQLSGRSLSLAEIAQVALAHEPVEIAAAAEKAINASRKVVEEIVARGAVIYGVSTGFGKLADVHIPPDKLEQLQVNLVRSHSCGIGRPLPGGSPRDDCSAPMCSTERKRDSARVHQLCGC